MIIYDYPRSTRSFFKSVKCLLYIRPSDVSSPGVAFFGWERTRCNKNKSNPTLSDQMHPCPRCRKALLGRRSRPSLPLEVTGAIFIERVRVNRRKRVATLLAPSTWSSYLRVASGQPSPSPCRPRNFRAAFTTLVVGHFISSQPEKLQSTPSSSPIP